MYTDKLILSQVDRIKFLLFYFLEVGLLKEGKKTKLIPFGREHFHKWIEWHKDPENIEFFRNFNFPLSADEIEVFYTGFVLGHFDKKFFVIHTVKDNKPIGMIHLFDLNWQARKVELGILVEKEHRSKGHAFDALLVMGDYVFNRLNLNKVYIRVLESNKTLVRFCKKGGFKIEGILKEEVYQNGGFHNQLYLALFQSEFKKFYQ